MSAAHDLAAALQNLLDTVGDVCPDLDPDVIREGVTALRAYETNLMFTGDDFDV